MARRSPIDIIAVIIIAVRSGNRKRTHIMYEANLNWSQLNAYLDYMKEKGLIDYNDDGSVSITNKGITFLELYQKLVQILND